MKKIFIHRIKVDIRFRGDSFIVARSLQKGCKLMGIRVSGCLLF